MAANPAMLAGNAAAGQQQRSAHMQAAPLGGAYHPHRGNQQQQQNQIDERTVMRLRIIRDVCKRLVNVIAKCNDESSTILEVLDIMVDIVDKYPSVIDEHVQVLNAMLHQLTNRRLAVRKRAVACIGGMVRILQQQTFEGLMERLLSRSLTTSGGSVNDGQARARGAMDETTQIETLSGKKEFDFVYALTSTVGFRNDHDSCAYL